MNSQKQFKLFQARTAFERQATYVRTELQVSTRTCHLQPVLEFLEWLVRDMADLAGMTTEVKSHAQALAVLCGQVASRSQQIALQQMLVAKAEPAKRAAKQPKRAKPRLWVVK